MSETNDKKKFLGLSGIRLILDNLKEKYSPLEHTHDDLYYTENEVDGLLLDLKSGNTVVAKAEEATHATNADKATSAEHANEADHAETADEAIKAEQDGNGNVIVEVYETKTEATAKLQEAKEYTNVSIANLVNSAPDTLDTLGELAIAFNENKEVVDAINGAITNKVDKSVFDEHTHSWNDLEDKPFYEEQVKEIVVSECTVTAKYNEYSFAYWTNITSNAQSPQFNSGGEDFIVTVDGISYECTSWVNTSYDGDTFFIGDSRAMGEEGSNNIYHTNQEDVPFLVEFYFEQVGWDREFSSAIIYLKDSASHTIKVEKASENLQIIALDEKFIPNTIARIDNVITKIDPVLEGSFSLNRKVGSSIGDYSFSEGYSTVASGNVSHAEGTSTTASGYCSHAEGWSAEASGQYSHAEGYDTTASASSSHAEGSGTIASCESQHVQGKYNIEDTANKYAHIVGNGDSITPSNAHTLDWDGNAWYAGTIKLGGTSYDDASEVALKSDLENINVDLSAYETKANAQEKYDELAVQLDDKADKEHSHEISDVTDLQVELDKKANLSDIPTLFIQGTSAILGEDFLLEEHIATLSDDGEGNIMMTCSSPSVVSVEDDGNGNVRLTI